MTEFLLPAGFLGSWTIYSIYYLRKAYRTPSNVNPYVLDLIPSVFPTIGIMCTAIGIAYGLSDFDANDIQGSLPQLLGGLKSAFFATVLGIAGLIIFQKVLASVQQHIDQSPDRPRSSSDELSALNLISTQVENLERTFRTELDMVNVSVKENSTTFNQQIGKLNDLITTQTRQEEDHYQITYRQSESIIRNLTELKKAQDTYTKEQQTGVDAIVKSMLGNQKLLTAKFDEFSELLRKNNTEALVEVMRASTEQFNAQMSELIDKLVKENFKELNGSVQMLNTWQKENKEQVARLSEQVKTIIEQVDIATNNLKVASNVLTTVADVNQELVSGDGKLMTLVSELEKVMISDGTFTAITSKVEGAVSTLVKTTDAFDLTTQKLNVWVRNQMNFNEKAEILVTQLEEFRNLNGSVWDKYRAEMSKAVNIVSTTSTALKNDLENINQEFYERLNDTLQNLDGLIQRFMSGQPTNRR
ncbi:MotA/TolQ/ExbB proton channel family protein [Spirosoma linguale]|uniref:MotA/TolQ/ExbB proton channel domain-containing protein n=1 Tax=Spirosoma linguale (strain ATCC 33905 / DSM 74 / LMG 10896 / Claus 1) TaxID=504472 RepID=D2QV02_SPILD|nr:hypothetical protein Slin_6678 [Spirosoma linguale DSM 74]